ncbi:hypothetical protein G5C51_13400 [Streptomyces sp. A7024]|uniref:Uncharacterized protein n=1 Tax=Streptomyces coryli TaxID=1128680 RepID=A0A6G4U0I3_9ACTN|nr:hypothetical protein [Streptomyces coryli]NGN64888.1 hypothetical protein [Streptomyces coryli]
MLDLAGAITLLVVSFAAATWQLIWVRQSSENDAPATGLRAGKAFKTFRSFAFALPFPLLIAGVIWTELVRDTGEVDVTGRTHISPKVVQNGDTLTVTLEGQPNRHRLRLTLRAADAPGDWSGSQFCVPETQLGVALLGGNGKAQAERVDSGEHVDLRLGGSTKVRAQITVHTDLGCHMEVSVLKAVLHD